jgi:hypothetical protein
MAIWHSAHDEVHESRGGQRTSTRPRPHGGRPYDQGLCEGGCALLFAKFGFFNYIIKILFDFSAVLRDFGQYWGIWSSF